MSTTDLPAALTSHSRSAVEDFLHTECALLDAARYNEWLQLFTEDCTYWIPSQSDDIDPTRHVSLVYDDHQHLSERVGRLSVTGGRFAAGIAYAQEPRSRTARSVNNVRIVGVEADETGAGHFLRVDATFFVAEFRRGQSQLHAGTCRYRLRVEPDGGFRIKTKKVELINNAGHLGNLSILL